jgi:hypothetical protein
MPTPNETKRTGGIFSSENDSELPNFSLFLNFGHLGEIFQKRDHVSEFQ